MPSPVTPQDFKDVVPSASAGICEKFLKVFLRFPVLVYNLVNWMFNADGTVSDAFKAEVGGGADTVALAAPTNVSASDGTFTDKVTITWSPVSGAAYYEVYRSLTNDSAAATLLSSPTLTTYDDSAVMDDTTYFYFIKAKNASDTSAFSASDTGFSDTSGGGGGGSSGELNFTPGQTSWEVPTGVTTVEVQLWGSGGGGGGGLFSMIAGPTDYRHGGGGGSGGWRHIKNIPVTPGETLSFSVGAAGVGGGSPGNGGGGNPTFLIQAGSQIALVGGGGGGIGGGLGTPYGNGGSAGSVGSSSAGSLFASSAGTAGTASSAGASPTPGTGGAEVSSGGNQGGNGGGQLTSGDAGGPGKLRIKWPTT